MRPPSLNLESPAAKRQELLALAERVPGAWIGMKIAALLLIVEGQRPGWIAEVLGLTRMSLCRWIHAVNEQGVQSLVPQPKAGRPATLTPKMRRELEAHLERRPQRLGRDRSSGGRRSPRARDRAPDRGLAATGTRAGMGGVAGRRARDRSVHAPRRDPL